MTMKRKIPRSERKAIREQFNPVRTEEKAEENASLPDINTPNEWKEAKREAKKDRRRQIQEAGRDLGAIASEKKISLVSDLHAVQILANCESLSRMIDNLITNAILYNKPGGKVFITLSRSDNKAVLEIKDTGVGISEEHLPFIFERFYRIQGQSSKVIEGTGLGLSIVKHIIEVHEEKIYVESKLAVGSEFSFTLQKQN